jgi:hypothetical protein
MLLENVFMHYLLTPRALPEFSFLITLLQVMISHRRDFNDLVTVLTRSQISAIFEHMKIKTIFSVELKTFELAELARFTLN